MHGVGYRGKFERYGTSIHIRQESQSRDSHSTLNGKEKGMGRKVRVLRREVHKDIWKGREGEI